MFTRLPDVGGRQTVMVLSRLRRLAGELAEGVRTAAGVPALRWPLLAVAAHRLLLGAGFVVLVLIADSRYHLRIRRMAWRWPQRGWLRSPERWPRRRWRAGTPRLY